MRLEEDPQAVVAAAVEGREVPGAVAVYGTREGITSIAAHGFARLAEFGGESSMRADTLFDLASLTKVVATLPSVLALVGDGQVSLEDRLVRFFPNAQGLSAEMTLRSLLSHSSGLPASLPLYRQVRNVTEALPLILSDSLEVDPGRYVYSDLGFILLGAVVEQVSGRRLDEFARERTFRPLGMADTGFGPVLDRQVAATEQCPLRGRLMKGEVHDENAFALGGVCGHAGLFGTAEDLATYALAWLRLDERIGPQELLAQATAEQLEQDGVRRGFGWMLRGEDSSAGQLASRSAFGHTGFTGTSLWCDPVQGWFAVLLTNRVHPKRDDGKRIQRLRKEFHEAVAARKGT